MFKLKKFSLKLKTYFQYLCVRSHLVRFFGKSGNERIARVIIRGHNQTQCTGQ